MGCNCVEEVSQWECEWFRLAQNPLFVSAKTQNNNEAACQESVSGSRSNKHGFGVFNIIATYFGTFQLQHDGKETYFEGAHVPVYDL
jgi:hypothetical protein